ncbi:MAG: HIRAN domain-containing protein [Clostridia bacterium]|jgi:hypothetical protein|nr:HIRAN domain-containing protein [Clostridia bacterium]
MEFFDNSSSYLIGRKRITGIYQTGRRLYIKNNTERGDTFRLRRDYGNLYDVNAVEVVDMKGDRIGYIEARANSDVAFFMDNGIECFCRIAAVDRSAATVGIAVDVFCMCDSIAFEETAAAYRAKIIKEQIGK